MHMVANCENTGTILSVNASTEAGSGTPRDWFDNESLVSQFPWMYRQYARYCRAFISRPTGRVRGGTALFKLLSKIHILIGGQRSCGVSHADNKIYLDLSDNRIFEVLEEVSKESGERRILATFLKPGDTFVDIGANHGSYSLIASKIVGRAGIVVAFEPQQHLGDLVRQSLYATGSSDSRVFPQGCGSTEKVVQIYVPKHASGSAGMFRGFSALGSHSIEKVDLTTIDHCFGSQVEVRGSLFFKLDVEGSEYDVIMGARETIQRFRPAILFEVNPTSAAAAGFSLDQLFELLENYGYHRVCEIDEFPRSRKIREADRSRQRNLLAIHDRICWQM